MYAPTSQQISVTREGAGLKRAKPFIVGGILAGQVAGLVMAVVVMAVFTALGKGPLYPVQVIGSAVFGEAALQGTHIGAILAGLLLHQLGPSVVWGLVFGLLAYALKVRTGGASLLLGLVVGAISMVGPYFLIPILMTALQGVDIWNREVPMFWDWAAHLVFGASLGIFPKFLRKFEAR